MEDIVDVADVVRPETPSRSSSHTHATRESGRRQAGLFFFAAGVGHGGVQPRTGVSPGTVGGGKGDAQASRCLLQGQTAEEAQLDQLRLERTVAREALRALVKGGVPPRGPAGAGGLGARLLAPPSAAVLLAPLAAGILDEDAPHGLGGGGEEVPLTVPPPIPRPVNEPEVRLVDQC